LEAADYIVIVLRINIFSSFQSSRSQQKRMVRYPGFIISHVINSQDSLPHFKQVKEIYR